MWADLLLPPPRKRRGVAPRSKPRPDRGFRRERLSTSGSGRITGSRRTSGPVRKVPQARLTPAEIPTVQPGRSCERTLPFGILFEPASAKSTAAIDPPAFATLSDRPIMRENHINVWQHSPGQRVRLAHFTPGFVASGPITFCVYLVALQHLLPIYSRRDSKRRPRAHSIRRAPRARSKRVVSSRAH